MQEGAQRSPTGTDEEKKEKCQRRRVHGDSLTELYPGHHRDSNKQ